MSDDWIFYNHEVISSTAGFSLSEKQVLAQINSLCTLDELLNNQFVMRQLEFEFVYASAKIEGSRITRQQTSNLLTTGKSIGVPVADEVMVLNLKKAYDYIMSNDLDVSLHTMHEIHALLSNGLLKNPRDIDGMKNEINSVQEGIRYQPLGPGPELKGEMDTMLKIYKSIQDPFDRALYLHNNTAYLQYFSDCNKRVSRCMMLVSTNQDKILPFIAQYKEDTEVNYLNCMLDYYASGSNEQICSLFVEIYLDLGRAIDDSYLIKDINGQINKFSETAVITTNDGESQNLLEKIGEQRACSYKVTAKIYFADLNKILLSGINFDKCKIYPNLKAFLKNNAFSTEYLNELSRALMK